MAAGRSLKSLLGRRRRVDEEGEDEDGPVAVENSQSEGSVISDLADNEADTSTVGGGESSVVGGSADVTDAKPEATANGSTAPGKKPRKSKKQGSRKQDKNAIVVSSQTYSPDSSFKAMADTEAMMNGLKISTQEQPEEVVQFDASNPNDGARDPTPSAPAVSTPVNGSSETPVVRNRREHEEYRRKRDADPAFIPNKGNFFMHDTRTTNDRGGWSTRGAWNGRGRGRGVPNISDHLTPANQMSSAGRVAEQPWKHDLHDTINEELGSAGPPKPADTPQDQDESARIFPKASTINQTSRPPVLNFSRTTLEGTIQIRVILPGMKAPVVFSEVPWKKYTRLPDHRPPLRRDKPVRISIAGHTQRYIFPSPDRSFIFIPRQMRPNQQGFGRSGYQRSIGGYGYSSRRTSMYGGSMYANSVAASRRSSFASIARDNAFSPVGSYGGHMPPNRPVVRLPHGSQSHFSVPTTPMGPLSGYQTPIGVQVHTYPLPQQPAFQGTPTTKMHQPRPQKAISVNDIETPAVALQHEGPLTSEQPFQNQLPPHMIEQQAYSQQPQTFYPPQQPYQFAQQQQQQQAAATTPLSGIPEQAVHAAAFPPPNIQYGQAGYYNPFQQQGYYYPQGPNGYQPMPMYMPPVQGFGMPPSGPVMQSLQATPQAPPQPTSSQPVEPERQSQSQPQPQAGIVAEERNGMVFYRRTAEAQREPSGDTFQPVESFVPQYAMPPTPAPEPPYFYPQMQVPSMQDAGQALYYPTQPPHQQ